MNSYRLSLCGGQQTADRTSEPFMAFGIYCHILYFIIFAEEKQICNTDIFIKLVSNH